MRSVHSETKLNEFSCGPTSDLHAGGGSQKDFRDSYHQFLRVIGGYLSVKVDRPLVKPTGTFRFQEWKEKFTIRNPSNKAI